MSKDKTENPKATSKTVVLTLKVDADSMAELYARIANIVSSVENSADVESVDVRDNKKSGSNYSLQLNHGSGIR